LVSVAATVRVVVSAPVDSTVYFDAVNEEITGAVFVDDVPPPPPPPHPAKAAANNIAISVAMCLFVICCLLIKTWFYISCSISINANRVTSF